MDWEDDIFDYLVVFTVPGRTLASAWSTLEDWQQDIYQNKIVRFYSEMAEWKGSRIETVDGKELREGMLFWERPPDYSHERLAAVFAEFGVDTEDLVFQHMDMHPGNIIVADAFEYDDPTIIDWELAGFAPREWILTKAFLNDDFGDGDRRLDFHAWMTLAGFTERAQQFARYSNAQLEKLGLNNN